MGASESESSSESDSEEEELSSEVASATGPLPFLSESLKCTRTTNNKKNEQLISM